jgi:hypothetical protein
LVFASDRNFRFLRCLLGSSEGAATVGILGCQLHVFTVTVIEDAHVIEGLQVSQISSSELGVTEALAILEKSANAFSVSCWTSSSWNASRCILKEIVA